MNALKRELCSFAPQVSDRQVISVFIGGGTPSVLKAGQIGDLMETVGSCYSLAENAEITIEANPGTLTGEKLEEYRQAGINRLSMGAQSFRDEELLRLGRIHTAEHIPESFFLAREAGFDNISLDLIFGLPGQKLIHWQDTLEKAAALMPEHISAYSLIIEEGTPFYEQYQGEDLRRSAGEKTDCLPDEETEREMYRFAYSFLQKKGYGQYEISNYAKPGRQCIHNTGYWIRREYIGFGLGAASLFWESRWKNTSRMEEYLAAGRDPKDVREEIKALTKEEQMEELMYLGLRMTEGVGKEFFFQKTGKCLFDVYGRVIEKLKAEGLLLADERGIRLADRGMDLANYCMAQFLL